MKISDKQLQMLFQIAIDSLPILGAYTPFKYTPEARRQLVDDILNQQSDEIIEIKKDDK